MLELKLIGLDTALPGYGMVLLGLGVERPGLDRWRGLAWIDGVAGLGMAWPGLAWVCLA